MKPEIIAQINAKGGAALDQLYTLLLDKCAENDPEGHGLNILLEMSLFMTTATPEKVRALPDGKLAVLINIMDLGLREGLIRMANRVADDGGEA